MPRRTDLPPQLSGKTFSIAEALSNGVRKGRLGASDLTRPFHGVRVSGKDPEDPLTLVELCHAFTARTPAPHAFSHSTAAQLHNLPLPQHLSAHLPLHVVVDSSIRAPRVSQIVSHKAEPATIAIGEFGGVPVVSALDAWRQLSTMLDLDDLIIAGDALVRRQSPLASMSDLDEAVRRHGSRRGARSLREAIKWIRPRTDSPRETVLRLALTRAGLPEPEVNSVILGPGGRFLALGDLVYRHHRILVEYDGGQHRNDERQYHRDIDRLDEVMAERWRVIRVNKTHLRDDSRRAIAKVRHALLAAGWRP